MYVDSDKKMIKIKLNINYETLFNIIDYYRILLCIM